MKRNREIHNKINASPELQYTELQIRDSLYGGRCEPFSLYRKVKPGERIHFFDICSLYPSVLKYGRFCVGNVKKVYRGSECQEIEGKFFELEGVIKARVLPRNDLFIPVLPIRIHNKLFFPLCAMCADKMQTTPCAHTEFERSLLGSWSLFEFKFALSRGYRLMEIIEIWSYDKVEYCNETQSNGLFSDFVNTFMKIKVEASGWPRGCDTDEQKDAYIKHCEEVDGIVIDKDAVKYNSSYRNCSKVINNSLWGRLCLSTDYLQTTVLRK